MDVKELNRFFSGSWKGYTMVDPYDYEELSPCVLKSKLEDSFKRDFKTDCICFLHNDLLCIAITLEEIHRKKPRKKKQIQHPQLRKFRLAMNFEESILFCHIVLNSKFRSDFAAALNCTDLVPYELTGSSPIELLLLHKQASQAKKEFQMDLEGIKIFEDKDVRESASKIGPDCIQMPKIRNLSARLMNVDMETTDNIFKDIRMSQLLINMSAGSLFDLYNELERQNVVKELPDWLIACRSSGKTHRVIKYE